GDLVEADACAEGKDLFEEGDATAVTGNCVEGRGFHLHPLALLLSINQKVAKGSN
ncbi:unnamed protein product, partial [Dovyalis caffra]